MRDIGDLPDGETGTRDTERPRHMGVEVSKIVGLSEESAGPTIMETVRVAQWIESTEDPESTLKRFEIEYKKIKSNGGKHIDRIIEAKIKSR